MVNINILIDDELHKAMKLKCVEKDLTIQQYLSNIISEDLKKRRP